MGKTGKARHGTQRNGKTKEERKRMKEEREQGKKTENEWKNAKINKEVGSTRLLRRSQVQWHQPQLLF